MLTNVHKGSIPQQNTFPDTLGQQALFHSEREIALILDKTVKGGYGALALGTIMAANSADGKLVPYPELLATSNTNNAKAYLVQNAVTATAIVYCNLEDAGKFVVGDSLIIDCDQAVDAQDLGAIVSIELNANDSRYIITATDNLSDAEGDFTTVNSVCIYCKGGDVAAPFSQAEYILDKDVDTGTGTTALGALTSVVLSNAILYELVLVGLDAAAKTDLGITSDGRFAVLK